jgi:hypothetical protein
LWRHYDSPDPLVDSTVSRREQEWRLGLFNEVPIAEKWALTQQFEYRTTSANLPNYERDNLILTVGVNRRF